MEIAAVNKKDRTLTMADSSKYAYAWSRLVETAVTDDPSAILKMMEWRSKTSLVNGQDKVKFPLANSYGSMTLWHPFRNSAPDHGFPHSRHCELQR